MPPEPPFVHPYIPNTAPGVREEMLREIGVDDLETVVAAQIPERLRLHKRLELPEALPAESELRRHLTRILARNRTCEENLNFLGGGCWQHYVPAVCDEIARRSEFLTGYFGEAYSDFGKYQALFEYQSLLGELVDMDVVCLPVYSWGCAAGSALRMAARMTGRDEVLLPRTISPERLAAIRMLCTPGGVPGPIDVKLVGYEPETGLLDLADLRRQLSARTAAVYVENPSYLGFVESQGAEISELAHAHGAESVVGVDPISLGVLAPPAAYGADIVVGDLQPLGVHMQGGGGVAGFIATRHEERYLAEHPSYLIGITSTAEGEHAFFYSLWERTSYMIKETDMSAVAGARSGEVTGDRTKDFTGTISILWGIVAGVYLALMGPQGMREVGETIVQRSEYAARRLSAIEGVRRRFGSSGFKEFVLDFGDTGLSVGAINEALLDHGIFGGKDLSRAFPELGQSALYCVTEIHRKDDVDVLAGALEEVLR